jgi:hypothetical protein
MGLFCVVLVCRWLRCTSRAAVGSVGRPHVICITLSMAL